MYSFVIPAFNEEAYIEKTINKIREIFNSIDADVTYEIIVCDNNSTDKTAQIARNNHCHVIHCPERSIAKARNVGASLAKGKWIIFLDADSFPSEELILKILIQSQCNNYIGFGAMVKVIDGKKWFVYTLESKNWSMKRFNWCLGGFICCRKSAFNNIGGFDEKYFAFEEKYFIKKLKQSAKLHKQKFEVLNSYFYTSGRKSNTLSILDFLKLAVSIWFNKKNTITNKDTLKYWYQSRE